MKTPMKWTTGENPDDLPRIDIIIMLLFVDISIESLTIIMESFVSK